MKIIIIFGIVIALIVIGYVIYLSLKTLKQVKIDAKLTQSNTSKTPHPHIKKELDEIARQRAILDKKNQTKK